MRKFSLFLLLATAAAPAFAQDEGSTRAERRAARQAEAAEKSDSGAQRQGRAERQGRRERQESASPGPFVQMGSGQGDSGQTVTVTRSDGNDSVRNWRRAEREARRDGPLAVIGTQEQSGSLTPRQRRIRTIPDTQTTVTQQAGEALSRNRRDYRDGRYSRWSRDHWRSDRRYDWRRYRDRNRSLFSLGFYYDPFGWNYRRHNIGWYMYPTYYSARYWLNDPWQYRLPQAYGPYRWVRYWDDALLVNIYTGEVVDVIHNFFW